MKASSRKLPLNPSVKLLKDIKTSDYNFQILDLLEKYIRDDSVLMASLIINPFGQTGKEQVFSKELERIIDIYNDLQKMNPKYIQPNRGHYIKEAKVLFLLSQMVLIKSGVSISKEKAIYCLKVSDTIHFLNLKEEVEDIFFRLLDPLLHEKYKSMLLFPRERYREIGEKVEREIIADLSLYKIYPEIQTRVKTIYSIYNKCTRKDLLPSQILDILGHRIIVDSIEDCYNVYSFLLKKWNTIGSKTKDYIARPKSNKYRSIHVTGIVDGIAIEFQIRSKEMHQHAQYGPSSHFQYKRELFDGFFEA